MADHRTLLELVRTQNVLVCVGSGGVGKTTVSAAIAMHAAQLGRTACVLTIDPARRLANALGLNELGNRPTRVEDARFDAAGVPRPSGRLFAMRTPYSCRHQRNRSRTTLCPMIACA